MCDSSQCPPKMRSLPGRLCLFLLRACSFGASNWVRRRLTCTLSLLGKGQHSVGNYSFIDKITLIEMEKGGKLVCGIGKNGASVVLFILN